MTTTDTSRTDESPAPVRASKWWNEVNFKLIVTVATLLIIAIPVGVANIYLGYILGESPCTSCSYERFGMVVVGGLRLLILRYGPRYKYVATLVAASFFFLYSTIRHWNYHVIDDAGQGFASEVFGVHTYTWEGTRLLDRHGRAVHRDDLRRSRLQAGPGVHRREQADQAAQPLPADRRDHRHRAHGQQRRADVRAQRAPPFAGKGGPPRTTFDLARATDYWRADLFTRVLDKPALLAMGAPMPHIPGDHEDTGLELATDPAAGPVAPAAGDLQVGDRTEIGFPVTGVTDGGNAAGLAYDEASGLFGLVSTDAGLYYVEDDFATIMSHGLVDRPNGSDIGHTVDATFLGPANLVAMAWNTTIYGAQRMSPDEVDEKEAWAAFLETSDDLMLSPEGRALLFTARAREQFALSIAGDPDTESYYVVSVPNEDEPQIVISQFASDNKLSREAVLTAGAEGGGADEADLAEYYPVGADFHDGNLYLLSKAYNSLLVVDAVSLELTAVHGVPEIGDFNDIVVNQDRMFVLSHEDGTDVVYQLDGLQ